MHTQGAAAEVATSDCSKIINGNGAESNTYMAGLK
jgi:hypothetical protein